ncbi:MAG TPA: HipA domain-containing protein, partial [Rhodocyclaceae bacterium]|nr:HipA domain-containing protein [Rhodocyclaceae bacterium]
VPQKLADMVLTDTEMRITKTPEAQAANLPGISLLHDLAGAPQFVYSRSEGRPLPPQLEVLLPLADTMNVQRRILQTLMELQGIELRGRQPAEQQWLMLTFAGRNGVGHLDVFEHDAAARAFYTPKATVDASPINGSSLWYAFRRFVQLIANEEEERLIVNTVGPTPGIAGFVPKLPTDISLTADGDWDGNLTPGRGLPVIVKIEQPAYPGLLALEALAYDYHARADFDVPRTWFKEIAHGGETIPVLAVERFDRQPGRTLPQESFYSLLHTGNRTKYRVNTDGTMEDLAKIFGFLKLAADQKEEWFARFVLAILTGNGDMHTENMAIVGGAGAQRLSPVFDPAPMRAYRGRASHNILSALPFTGIGGCAETSRPYAESGETPPDLGQRLIHFAVSIHIPKQRARSELARLVALTAPYRDEAIATLEAVPVEIRKARAPDIDGFAATLGAVRQACSAAL